MEEKQEEKTNYKLYIGIIVILVFVLIFENNPYTKKLFSKLVDDEKILTKDGIKGIIIYIIIGILLNTILFLYMPVNIISGYLFGFIKGFGISYIIVIISSIIAFYISRYIVKDKFNKIENKYLEKIKSKLNDNNTFDYIKYNVIGRVSPIPFHVWNYFWGTTDIGLPVYFIGTVIGVIPWMGAEIYSGSLFKNLHDKFKSSNRSNYILITLILGLSLYVLYKYLNEPKENISNNKDE